jgi:hypothetical protein
MEALLLVFDTGLMIFLCYWAITNDAAGNRGTPRGLFSYRGERPPPGPAAGRPARRSERR